MDIREATRKPFPVKVVQVTLANIHEVAFWCNGVVEQRPHRLGGTTTMLPVIVLNAQPKKYGEQPTEAGLGYWIVELKASFRAYKDAQFSSAFDLLPNSVSDPEGTQEVREKETAIYADGQPTVSVKLV